MSTINTTAQLNKLMNDKGFHSFEFYSLCPFENKKPKSYGNFKFLVLKESNGYGPHELYVRYIGLNNKFMFLNAPRSGGENSHWYNYTGKHKTIDGEDYCLLDRKYYVPSKNQTYSSTTIIRRIEDSKRYRENIKDIKTVHNIFTKEPDIKQFKKIVKQDKANWEQAKREVIKSVFNITLEEWKKDQLQVKDAEATQFILKIAPLLTRLRDECDLLLLKLNDEEGPSKAAKEDFTKAYKRLQGFYGNKSILYAIKTFKSKNGKGKTK